MCEKKLIEKDGEWQQPNSAYKGQWIPRKSDQLDDLVEEILDVCWIDKEENPATAKLIRKLLVKWTKGYYEEGG